MTYFVTDNVTVTPATVDANPTATRSLQWLRDSQPISGATGTQYTLTTSDLAKTISLAQTEANLMGSQTTTSNTVTDIQPFPISTFPAGELGVWYDTSDLTTMFQDTAGTIPVTAAGQLVARINPKYGSWSPLVQATVAAQPIVTIDSFGKPRVTFDAVDDTMSTSAAVLMNLTDEITIIAAMKFKSSTNAPSLLSVGGATTIGSYGLNRSTAASATFTAITRGSVAPTTFPSAGPYSGAQTIVASTRAKVSTDYSELFINGVSVSVGTGDMGTGGWRGVTSAVVGKIFGSSLDADVYGLFATNKLLTSEEHLAIVSYFNKRMGL